jgi:hypothetical protein
MTRLISGIPAINAYEVSEARPCDRGPGINRAAGVGAALAYAEDGTILPCYKQSLSIDVASITGGGVAAMCVLTQTPPRG